MSGTIPSPGSGVPTRNTKEEAGEVPCSFPLPLWIQCDWPPHTPAALTSFPGWIAPSNCESKQTLPLFLELPWLDVLSQEKGTYTEGTEFPFDSEKPEWRKKHVGKSRRRANFLRHLEPSWKGGKEAACRRLELSWNRDNEVACLHANLHWSLGVSHSLLFTLTL